MALPCRWCRNSFLIILIAAFSWFSAPAVMASRPFGRAVPAGETSAEGVITVELRLPKEASWRLPGRKIVLPVKLINPSSRAVGLYIELWGTEGAVVPGYISLGPGESRRCKLRVAPGGDEAISILFRGEHPQTRIEPNIIVITSRILPLSEALGRFLEPYRQALAYLALGTGAVALLFVAVGAILYLLLVRPNTRLQGSLYYRKGAAPGRDNFDGERHSDAYILEEARLRGIALADLEQDRCATIFMGLPEKVDSPALLFKTDGVPYKIMITPAWQSRLLFFLQGWEALFKPPLPAALHLECSNPGIVEVGGIIYSRKTIHPGEEFASGGYRFRYSLPAAPAGKQKGGTDLLLEKGMNTWQRLE